MVESSGERDWAVSCWVVEMAEPSERRGPAFEIEGRNLRVEVAFLTGFLPCIEV